jgi:SpoVK/Ycf46/Vps4 family AAA+-type ATPase
LRKGRFDEIFFIDLPSAKERKEIFTIHLKKRKREHLIFDLEHLAKESEGFSGAEIEQAIISSLYDAFLDNRDINDQDVLRNLKQSIPLSITMKENIDQLKDWAKYRARCASSITKNCHDVDKERRLEL